MNLDKWQTISTDTRILQSGDIFLALIGPNFDGHNFISEAIRKGAKAIIASKKIDCDIPVLLVKDTFITLGELAAKRREQVQIPIVALTGSCGKTTTKTMLAHIFNQYGNTLATLENLNNNIGVALTLLQLKPEHKFAVIEVGASLVGEIAYSANLIAPDVALITNACPVHLDGFGDLAGIAREKGQLLAALKPNGIAILNADDMYFDYWKTVIGGRNYISFSVTKDHAVDIYAKNIITNADGSTSFNLYIYNQSMPIHLPILGEHNILNALAAAAAAYAVNIPFTVIKAGLESVLPPKHRMIEKPGYNDAVIIDDTYNANPTAMSLALRVLGQRKGKKIFVVGQMGELGKDAEKYHYELGLEARKFGVDKLYALGKLTQFTVDAFGNNAYYFVDREELIMTVHKELKKDISVLIKGSNSNNLWEIVDKLVDPKGDK